MMLHLNGHTMGFWSRTQKLKLALHVSITESKLADLMHKQEHHNNKIDKDTHGAIYRQIFAVIAWQVSFKLSLKTQVVQHKGSTSEKKYLNWTFVWMYVHRHYGDSLGIKVDERFFKLSLIVQCHVMFRNLQHKIKVTVPAKKMIDSSWPIIVWIIVYSTPIWSVRATFGVNKKNKEKANLKPCDRSYVTSRRNKLTMLVYHLHGQTGRFTVWVGLGKW